MYVFVVLLRTVGTGKSEGCYLPAVDIARLTRPAASTSAVNATAIIKAAKIIAKVEVLTNDSIT